ncbi:Uu.00g085390.m01.CDS01 [Anthostomella pinea]|uniref:Uu.00g085390.m01.CDS01 n=1 Tax=Anthostomella pinea TaxID=933095 RepID=A0AAI8YJX7_9PEZI|nr:Uu.00g085390.m01.CDS01 [Anthostomella pinea]
MHAQTMLFSLTAMLGLITNAVAVSSSPTATPAPGPPKIPITSCGTANLPVSLLPTLASLCASSSASVYGLLPTVPACLTPFLANPNGYATALSDLCAQSDALATITSMAAPSQTVTEELAAEYSAYNSAFYDGICAQSSVITAIDCECASNGRRGA